jgi:hypothetical protein
MGKAKAMVRLLPNRTYIAQLLRSDAEWFRRGKRARYGKVLGKHILFLDTYYRESKETVDILFMVAADN